MRMICSPELQRFQGFCGHLPWDKTFVDIKIPCAVSVTGLHSKCRLAANSTYLDRGFRDGWKEHADRDGLQAARHAGGHQDVTSKQHPSGAALPDQARQHRGCAGHGWQAVTSGEAPAISTHCWVHAEWLMYEFLLLCVDPTQSETFTARATAQATVSICHHSSWTQASRQADELLLKEF